MNATKVTRHLLSLAGLSVLGLSTVACLNLDTNSGTRLVGQSLAAATGITADAVTTGITADAVTTITSGHMVLDPQADDRRIVETYTAPAATLVGSYGPETHQTYKVFTPSNWSASDRRDLVVFSHGGAWSFGTADEVESVSMDLLAQGAVIVSIEYELSVPAFEQTADIVAAVRWAQTNAGDLGVDPDRTFLSGHSAGAHLSLLTAVAPTDLRGGEFIRPVVGVIAIAGPYAVNEPTYDPAIIGIRVHEIIAFVNGCGTTDCSADVLAAISPATYVDANDPAVYMVVGEIDDLAPLVHALLVEDSYVAAGAGDRVWVDVVEGAGHQPGFGANATSIEAFMNSVNTI